MEDEPEIEQPEHAGILPKVPFRWAFIGPSMSGKTNLARFVLDHFYSVNGDKRKSYFKKIHLLSPTAHIDYSWSELGGLKNDDRHTMPTGETLLKILNEAKKKIQGTLSDKVPAISQTELRRRKAKADQFLLILDDAIAESALINSPEFLKIFYQIRHYGGSIMAMAQSYKKLPRAARLQLSHLSIFQPMLSEIEKINEDHGTKALNKKEFIAMVQDITQRRPEEEGGKYPFMHVESFAPLDIRYRRNLDTPYPIDEARVPNGENEVKMGYEGMGEGPTRSTDHLFTDEGQLRDSSMEDKEYRKKTGTKRKAREPKKTPEKNKRAKVS